MSDGAIAEAFAMAGLAAGAAFFAVWALAAPVASVMADVRAISVVRAVNISVSSLKMKMKWTPRIIRRESIPAISSFDGELLPQEAAPVQHRDNRRPIVIDQRQDEEPLAVG